MLEDRRECLYFLSFFSKWGFGVTWRKMTSSYLLLQPYSSRPKHYDSITHVTHHPMYFWSLRDVCILASGLLPLESGISARKKHTDLTAGDLQSQLGLYRGKGQLWRIDAEWGHDLFCCHKSMFTSTFSISCREESLVCRRELTVSPLSLALSLWQERWNLCLDFSSV